MTNKEKAKELSRMAQDTKLGKPLFAVSFPMGHRYIEDIEKSALEMAKWKDQQFKEYLEKKKAEYETESGTMRFGGDVIKTIINELFMENCL